MDFKFSPEQAMFRETISKFVEREVAPLVEEAEATMAFPRTLMDKAAQAGLIAVGLPEEFGGAGGDMMYISILVEEMGRECAGIALSIYPCVSMAMGIFQSASEEQKERYLGPLTQGKAMVALAITEPNAGSDVMAIQTTAVEDGDDYIINGTKVFITNGPIADIIIVIAKTKNLDGSSGMAAFIVDGDNPGLIREKKISKLGLRSSETSGLVFENCRVPTSDQWGGKSGGFVGLMKALDRSRVSIASLSIGIAEAAFHTALNYAKEREQFGRPIGKFQSIQNKLVDMAIAIENARLLTYKATQLINEGLPCTQEAAMAKRYASEAAVMITGEAVQILGGYGYSSEYPVERYFRDAKVLTIFEGTSEIQNIIIARELGL